MNSAVAIRLDHSGLSEVIALARVYSGRTPAVAANTAAYRITCAAFAFTPAATMAKIDQNMSAVTTPVLSTRGKRKGLPLRSGRNNVAVTEGGAATRIVLARMHMGSRYNRLTGWYWAINRHEFSPGQGQAGFWRKVYDTAVRMVKGRHSSTHFLKTGWIPGIRLLQQSGLISPSATRGLGVRPPAKRSKEIGEAGYAIPAREGLRTRCEVGNRIGLGGSNAILSEKHNRALHQYGGPALERAKAQEFAQSVAYVLKEQAKTAFAPAISRGLIKFTT